MLRWQGLGRIHKPVDHAALCCSSLLRNTTIAGDLGVPTTPIQPIVVILQQNRSSDRYFASNPPVAANLAGKPPFYARPKTPSVNRFLTAAGC